MPIIGIAQLLIDPVFTGGQQKVSKMVGNVMPRAGREAGQRLGRAVVDGFAEKSARLEAEVNQLAGVVSKAESDLDKSRARRSSARAAESKALGDLRVAELKLSELRDKSGAQASQIAAAEEKVSVSRQRATDATAAHQVALRSMSASMANLSASQHESSRASETLATHMRRVNTESENTERGVGRLGDRLRNAFHGSPLAGMVASIRNDSTRINVDLHKMANDVSSAGTRGGRAFTAGFMVVVGGLSAVTPAAGAAGAALVGASGNVLTLAASLGKLGGVAALIPASLMAIGGGAGVLITAFSGVGDALKAVTDQQDAFVANPRIAAMAVQDAMQSITVAEENAARAQESAARRVSDAKRSLQDTIAAVAETEKSAAESIVQATRRVVEAKQALKDAVESAAEAELNAAEAVESATRRVRDAKISLQDAVESAADAQKSAAKSVETAQRREVDAARDVTDAQNDLAEARKKSADAAADLAKKSQAADFKAIDTALALKRSHEELEAAKADPKSSATLLAQLEHNAVKALARDEAAKQSVADVADARSKAQADAKKGVDAVAKAEQKVADAKQAEIDSIQARKDAEAKVVKQARDGARQVARAQESVADALNGQQKAHASVAKAAESSARRIKDAQQSISDALKGERDARAELAKAGTDGARRIADAQLAVKDASADAKRSQVDSARSVADAHRGLERVQMQQADAASRAGDASSKALDDLTPSAREAVRALLKVKDQLGGIRRIAQENFFKGFTSPLLSLADTVMPQLAIGVGSIASALGAGAQDTMNSLSSALGGDVLTGLLTGIADSITIMNTAIDPLIQSFVTLGVVGMDYMPRFATAISDMATSFNDFIQAAAANGDLDRWIEDGIQAFKDLGSIVGSVSGIFGSLTKAAEAGGAVSTLGGLAQGLRDIDAAMQGETFQKTMTTIFAGAEAGSQGLLGALTKLNEAFVVGAPAFADFLRLGGEIAGTFVGGIFTALSNPKFGAGLTTFLEHVQVGVEDMVPLLPGLTGAFGSFLTALGPIVQNLGPSLVKVFTGFGESIAFVLRIFDPLLTAIAGSPAILGVLIGSFIATKAASAALTAAGNVQKIAMAGWWVVTKLGAVAMGAFSLAQGVATVVMGKSSRALIGNKVALVGYRVAMAAGAAATGIATAATWLFNGALKGIGGAVKAIPVIGWIITAVTLLTGALVWFFTKTELGQKIWGGFMNGIKDAAQGVSKWFTGTFMPGFRLLWENLPSFLADVGKNLMLGLLNGITGGNGQAVLDAFTGFVTGVIDWVKNLFGIHSPSTVFAEIGGFLLQGLANGVIAAVGLVKAAFGLIWSAIQVVISFAWEKVIKPIFTAMSTWVTVTLPSAFSTLRTKSSEAWQGVKDKISSIWGSVKGIFGSMRDWLKNTLGPAFTWFRDSVIKPVWDKISSIINGVWENGIKPIFDVIQKVLKGDFTGAFETAVSAIERIWNGLEAVAKKPISFIINTVLNKGLIGAFNKVAGWIPGVKELDPVSVPGFARGGWTGPGSKYQEAGVVHADEFVVKKESQRSIARVAPGFLDSLNNLGAKALGYFNGGLVKPVKNGRITSGFGASRGKYPHAGTDFAVPIGTPVFAAADGVVQRAGTNAITGRTGIGGFLGHEGNRNTYYGHLSRMLVQVGDMVKAGQQIALSGNTGRSTGPHLHFETWTGGKPVNAMPYLNGATLPEGGESGGAGGLNPLSFITDAAKNMAGQFANQFPGGGMLIDLAKGVGSKLFGDVTGWLGSKLAAIGDVGQDTWGNVKDFFNGKDSDVQAQVRGVANEYGWGSGRHWDSLSKLISKESSWNPNAANPVSSARGLFQKMTSLHGPVESTPEGQARWGLDYIKGRYGDPEKAWAFHKRNNSYSDGGLVDRPILHDKGGVLNPGLSTILNASRKPEAILSNKQWADISHLALSRENGAGKVSVTVVAPEQATANEYFGVAKHQLAVMNRRGGGRG